MCYIQHVDNVSTDCDTFASVGAPPGRTRGESWPHPTSVVRLEEKFAAFSDHWAQAIRICDMMRPAAFTAGQGGDATVANKDKGGRSGKKAASKSLKEKRQAKKDKRAGNANKPTPL